MYTMPVQNEMYGGKKVLTMTTGTYWNVFCPKLGDKHWAAVISTNAKKLLNHNRTQNDE